MKHLKDKKQIFSNYHELSSLKTLIALYFSEYSAKRIKIEDIATSLMNRNSIMTMDDHIIDKIIDCLKLVDCKRLSLTCHRLNDHFSKSKHIDRFWLNLKHVQPLTVELLMESPRGVNKNVIWHDEVPTTKIEFLSPNLKRLKITMTPVLVSSRYQPICS